MNIGLKYSGGVSKIKRYYNISKVSIPYIKCSLLLVALSDTNIVVNIFMV